MSRLPWYIAGAAVLALMALLLWLFRPVAVWLLLAVIPAYFFNADGLQRRGRWSRTVAVPPDSASFAPAAASAAPGE